MSSLETYCFRRCLGSSFSFSTSTLSCTFKMAGGWLWWPTLSTEGWQKNTMQSKMRHISSLNGVRTDFMKMNSKSVSSNDFVVNGSLNF